MLFFYFVVQIHFQFIVIVNLVLQVFIHIHFILYSSFILLISFIRSSLLIFLLFLLLFTLSGRFSHGLSQLNQHLQIGFSCTCMVWEAQLNGVTFGYSNLMSTFVFLIIYYLWVKFCQSSIILIDFQHIFHLPQ